MDDKLTPVTPGAAKTIPSVAGDISALASAQAPFIFFEGVPNFGIASFSLEVARFTAGTSGIVAGRVVVAHLRMAPEGLRQLKAAIEGIERLAQPVADDKKN
jgi:hypothetical protein